VRLLTIAREDVLRVLLPPLEILISLIRIVGNKDVARSE
jgi:hypothetical protein